MILLISQYSYPNGDAGSVRFHNFALSYKQLGYNVFVIGLGEVQKEIGYYKGIPYISLRVRNKYNSRINFCYRLYKQIQKIKKTDFIEAVLLGTSTIDVFLFLKYFCFKYKICFVKDVVEWYSTSQFRFGKYSFSYLTKELENRFFIDKKTAVISVSSYLNKYFAGKGIKTVKVPVYMDQCEIPYYPKKYTNKLVLIYAGSPGKKDHLDIMLNALALLSPDLLKMIQFNIIGVNKKQIEYIFRHNILDLFKIKDCLIIYGKISRDKVIEKLKEADFSVLLRSENERYAKAGFPTKVVESISLSLPIIMNFTSDLEWYFTDMENCIKVENDNVHKFKEALEKALSLTPEKKRELAQNAKTLAEHSFNTDSYLKELLSIVQK